MNALERGKQFYLEYGAKLIHDEFHEFEGRIAVGLTGHGSECFGYDDDISKDHDYEIGFSMFLTREDEAKIGFKLSRAYDKLRVSSGLSENPHLSVSGGSGHGVQIIGDFFRRYTGSEHEPDSLKDWLFTDDEYLAEAVNGEVWRDDLGEFTKIRENILNIPEDVRLKKLAAYILRMAQTGQYNYARCLMRGEDGGAMLAICEFVKLAIKTIFLLNGKYCPYYKWAFRGLKDLTILSDLHPSLEFLLTGDNDKATCKVKAAMADDIALAIANELKRQNLAACEGSYLEPYAYEIQKKIKSAELRNLHILVGA